MAYSLPPLTWLRAFEAAARLGNFTRAAEELLITPAAVSYQVRQLEQLLGLERSATDAEEHLRRFTLLHYIHCSALHALRN